MFVNNGKTYYEWNDYVTDINSFSDMVTYNCSIDNDVSKGVNPKSSIVSIYRGSLGMGSHLSNVLDLPLSVLQYQTRDGNDEVPKMVINTITNGEPIIIIDDIVDSGKTMRDVTNFLAKEYPDSYLLRIAIFGSEKHRSTSMYCREHTGDWIVFPWEYIDAEQLKNDNPKEDVYGIR